MPEVQTYKNWKTVTEADFLSLFIKTWFAYISTLRTMFPEAYNRKGDKKYLNAYKDFYKRTGFKKLIVDENLMASIEKIYSEGRNIIMQQYPEYYLWDFYRINENFEFSFRDIPPDRKNCMICGLKLYRNRGTSRSFVVTGFVKFFGDYHAKHYDENLNFQVNISDVLNSAELYIKDNPQADEQVFLSWILDRIYYAVKDVLLEKFTETFEVIEQKYGKRMLARANDIAKEAISTMRGIFLLNAKDEAQKTYDEMLLSRNTYELIQQRPKNYFQFHMTADWRPQRKLLPEEEEWYRQLFEELKTNSVIWFLDFVYRLRNALFHEIIDPLNEEWQIIFKNAYLVLKEIVELNIAEIEEE